MTGTAVSVAIPESPRAPQLAALEQLPLRLLMEGTDASAIVKFAEGLAGALAGNDGEGARRRMLSKAIAGERGLQLVLETALAVHVRAGNSRAVASVTAALDAAVRRLERLAAAHRADIQSDRRPVVFVGNAEQVHVDAR